MEPIATGRFAPATRTFALRGTVAALMGIGVLTSVSVRAQEVGAAQDASQAAGSNVVVVSGQRQALQSAQVIKKNADQVVDTIVADDIGKFPDKNVAELLGRITGVQILRNGGEASNVVIRGLGGVTTLFNGREMFTAADRNLNLTDIPVSMLNRVDVYKSQGADMVEGGTAGVIDVRTWKPFDFKGQQTAINVRAEHRDKAGKTDPQIGGMWSNRWKTDAGEFGILGGLSYQRGRYHDEVSWAGQPVTFDQADIAGARGPDTMGRVMTEGDRKRVAANFAAQWRPNRDLEFYAEGFSTKIDVDSGSLFFIAGLPVQEDGSIVKTVTDGGNRYVTDVTNPNSNSSILSSQQAARDWSKGSQLALGTTWKVSPSLRASSELVRTVSTYRHENPIVDVFYTGGQHAVTGGVRDGGGYIDYPGVDLVDPSKWSPTTLFDNRNHSNGAANDWRGDVRWTPADDGLVKEVSGGVRWAQRDASFAHELGNVRPVTTGVKANGIPGFACTSPSIYGNYGVSRFFTGCVDYMLDNTGALRQALLGTSAAPGDDPLSYYKFRETTSALYGNSRLGFDAFGIPVETILGVRVVRTKQNITGNSRAGDNGAVTPVNVTSSNTDVLPSLNVRVNFRDDLVGRLVAGKAVQRAAFGDYNPGTVLGNLPIYDPNDGIVHNPPTGAAGNPNLKPTQSRNLDVSLEWYFSKDGSLTGAVFQHDFKDFLRHKSALETFNGVQYLIDRPYNLDTAKLYGFEGAYQQFFPQLPGWMSGLGVQANFTFMDGGMNEPDGSRHTFAGMSKWAYNVVGLYERGPWSARVAYNWRGKFIDTYDYRGLKPSVDIVVEPIKTLDASLSYKITENLTATLDGSNLLNQTYHDYHSTPLLPRDVRRYDRVVGVALRWKH